MSKINEKKAPKSAREILDQEILGKKDGAVMDEEDLRALEAKEFARMLKVSELEWQQTQRREREHRRERRASGGKEDEEQPRKKKQKKIREGSKDRPSKEKKAVVPEDTEDRPSKEKKAVVPEDTEKKMREEAGKKTCEEKKEAQLSPSADSVPVDYELEEEQESPGKEEMSEINDDESEDSDEESQDDRRKAPIEDWDEDSSRNNPLQEIVEMQKNQLQQMMENMQQERAEMARLRLQEKADADERQAQNDARMMTMVTTLMQQQNQPRAQEVGAVQGMVTSRDWNIMTDLTDPKQLGKLEEDLKFRDAQGVTRHLRQFVEKCILEVMDDILMSKQPEDEWTRVDVGGEMELQWHTLKAEGIMKIFRNVVGGTLDSDPIKRICIALQDKVPVLIWHPDCPRSNLEQCVVVRQLVTTLVPPNILESKGKGEMEAVRDTIKNLMRQTDFGGHLLRQAEEKLQKIRLENVQRRGNGTPSMGGVEEDDTWTFRAWMGAITEKTIQYNENLTQLQQMRSQSDGTSSTGNIKDVIGCSKRLRYQNGTISREAARPEDRRPGRDRGLDRQPQERRQEDRSDRRASRGQVVMTRPEENRGRRENPREREPTRERDRRTRSPRRESPRREHGGSKETTQRMREERPAARGVGTSQRQDRRLTPGECDSHVPCCACGGKNHNRKECVLDRGTERSYQGNPHPDVNKESCRFHESAIGKRWRSERNMINVPFKMRIDGSLRQDEPLGKITTRPNNITMLHHMIDNHKEAAIPDGMVTCMILPHKSNSSLPLPQQEKPRKVRVLLDPGSLGNDPSYIDKRIAAKLRKMGYEEKRVKNSKQVCMCGQDVKECVTLTHYFKIRCCFTRPDTDQHINTTLKVYVTNITRNGRDPQVIVGLRDIRRSKIYQQLILEMLSRPNPDETGKKAGDDDSDNEDSDDDDEKDDSDNDDDDDEEEGYLPKPAKPPEVKTVNERSSSVSSDQVSEQDKTWTTGTETTRRYESWGEVPEEHKLGILKIGNDSELTIEETLAICQKVKEVFSRELRKNAARLKPMQITVEEADWVSRENQQPPRQVSRLKEEEIKKQVQSMVNAEVVGQSRANAHSQVTLAKKPDGTWRFCIDFRRLNAVTKADCKWPLPRINAMLERLGAKQPKYFGVLDLTKGYYQAPIDESCRHLTAFITPDGVWEWKRVAMGLKGAPSYFQRAMTTEVLPGLLYEACEVYLDDIIVFGRTKTEYLHNLERVLTRLNEFNITVNPKKCKLGLTQIEYVGHTIDATGCSFEPVKLQKAMSIDRPKTEKQLKSFLGVANYFRDHICNHSAIVAPLHELMTAYAPKRTVIWTDEGIQAFDRIKKALSTIPKLFWIDEHAPIHLYTDASKLGIGAYLCQMRDGKQVPIRFFSKSLNKSQKGWDVPRLEAYAIYAAFKEFAYLLRDGHTHVHTDHKNLIYIKDTTNEVVLRWKMHMMPYSFDIQHVRGEDNPIADYWSRLEEAPLDDYDLQEDEVTGTHMVSNMLHFVSAEDKCPDEPEYQEEIRTICNNILFNLRKESDVVQKEHKDLILKVHNAEVGHHGVKRTIELLEEQGKNWETRDRDVRRVLRACHTCQKMDVRVYQPQVDHYTVGTYGMFDRLNIDTIGPLPMTEEGYDHIVVIIDSFSRYMTLYPAKGIDGVQAAEALLHHMGNYGAPNEVLSDGGPEYATPLIRELLGMTGTEHLLTIAYSKAENSMVERANKEVNRWTRDILYDKRVEDTEWIYYLPFVQRIHNATTVSSIGASPAQLVFGDRFDLNRNFVYQTKGNPKVSETIRKWTTDRQRYQDQAIQIAKELETKHARKAQEHNKTRFENSEEGRTKYAIGDKVLLNTPTSNGTKRKRKFDPIYTGPYEVIDNDNNHYLIRDLISKVTQHVGIWRMKPYIGDETAAREVAKYDHKKEFDVKEVISHTGTFKRRNKMTFRIRWDGIWDKPEYDTDEPWSNVRKSVALHEYLEKIGQASQIPKMTENERNDGHIQKRSRDSDRTGVV
jgi:hypothetical protein